MGGPDALQVVLRSPQKHHVDEARGRVTRSKAIRMLSTVRCGPSGQWQPKRMCYCRGGAASSACLALSPTAHTLCQSARAHSAQWGEFTKGTSSEGTSSTGWWATQGWQGQDGGRRGLPALRARAAWQYEDLPGGSGAQGRCSCCQEPCKQAREKCPALPIAQILLAAPCPGGPCLAGMKSREGRELQEVKPWRGAPLCTASLVPLVVWPQADTAHH